jgi:hypothetical protein
LINQNSARGAVLAAVSLYFAGNALRYPIGNLSHAGPGLFPLLVSAPLLIIALLMIVQARISAPVPLSFNIRNIALIMLGLTSFVLGSKFVNGAVGIVAMVFIAGFAGTNYSVVRNVKIALGLIAVAYAFEKFLGLNLRLF